MIPGLCISTEIYIVGGISMSFHLEITILVYNLQINYMHTHFFYCNKVRFLRVKITDYTEGSNLSLYQPGVRITPRVTFKRWAIIGENKLFSSGYIVAIAQMSLFSLINYELIYTTFECNYALLYLPCNCAEVESCCCLYLSALSSACFNRV